MTPSRSSAASVPSEPGEGLSSPLFRQALGALELPDPRAHHRQPCRWQVRCRLPGSASCEAQPAQVVDISPGGLGLRTSWACLPGRWLTVEFPEGSEERAFLIRTAYAVSLPDGGWRIGGVFARAPAVTELQHLLFLLDRVRGLERSSG
jgi:hypothetical protein